MPKSSRHRSHRSRRHSVDPSESSEEDYSREKKIREDEARVSRDIETEKRRASLNLDAKEIASVNGELAGESGKKRKERGAEGSVSDRWISGEDVVRKSARRDDLQIDKSEKSRSLSSDLKYRSSRKVQSSGDVNEEKRKSDRVEKESSGQYKDSKEGERGSERNREKEGIGGQSKDSKKERERVSKWDREEREYERGSEKDRGRDKEAQNASHDKVEDVPNKKRGFKAVDVVEEDPDSRKDAKAYERQIKDLKLNSEMERGLEKNKRGRFDSEDKRIGDGGNKDDKRSSTRDDSRLRTYRDDRNEDGKSRDEADSLDRDKKQRREKNRDEYSRDRASGRSERKYSRDENSPVDGRYRKSNIHDSNQYGSYADDRDAKYKENRGKKRSLEDNDDFGDLKSRSGRGLREETEKYSFSNIKSESHTNYRHSDKRETSPRNSRGKTSAASSVSAVKEHNRDPPKLAEFVSKESSSEARVHSTAASAGHATATGARERVNRVLQEKTQSSNDDCFVDICSDTVVATKYERGPPRSDSHTSPGWLKEKSPSKSVQRSSEKNGAIFSLDVDGREKGSSRDGVRRELCTEKAIANEAVQTQNYNRERTPVGSAFSRTGHGYGALPGRLPPPSLRRRTGSPSALGSFEDESGGQVGDRRPYNRSKRGGDHSFGWGQGNSWKGGGGGGPSWPSPVANGFIPLPHGPPPATFHPAMPQFPASPFFGVRPSMDMRQTGVPFHMPDIGENYSSHGRQFGWHTTVDQTCPPRMQVWDGNNGAFRDESHMYGRLDWEPNRHLIGSRGWAMSAADMWKAQNKESEFHPPSGADEGMVGQPGKKLGHEVASPVPIGSTVSSDPLVDNKETHTTIQKKFLGPGKTSGEEDASFTAYYLSRIDISPDLVDFELYKKSTSVGHTVESSNESSSVVHRCIQYVDNRGMVKIGSNNQMTGLPSLTAKDAIFEKSMALYSKQNEKFKYKLKETPENPDNEKMQEAEDEKMQESEDEKIQEASLPHADSSEKETPENPDNEKMQEAEDEKIQEASLPHADSSEIMEARNISADTLADNSVAVGLKSNNNSDEIISNNGFQASKVFMEDSSEYVNRIHHPRESTH